MLREENVRRRRSQEKRYPKIRIPRERDVNDIGFKRKRWHHVRREECVKSLAPELSARRAVKMQKHVRSKPDQEKVTASDKMSRNKKCQGQKLRRVHAVDSRASQAVRRRSFGLSLVLVDSSVTRLARILLV